MGFINEFWEIWGVMGRDIGQLRTIVISYFIGICKVRGYTILEIPSSE